MLYITFITECEPVHRGELSDTKDRNDTKDGREKVLLMKW